MVIILTEKTPQNNCFIQIKPLLWSLKLEQCYFLKKKMLVLRHINVSYNNQTCFRSQIVLL